MVVYKKDSDEIHLCGVFSHLNNNIKRAVFPTAKIDVTLAKLRGAKVFSKLDAKSDHHQIRLDKESQPLTTFITPFGRYMHTRLPFGVNCASDYFSKKFVDLLAGIPNIVVHIGDVLAYSELVDRHKVILESIFKRLAKEGVTLNKEKCIFAAKEIEFLVHKISEQGISIIPKRISAVSNFPEPRDKDSLLQFVGAVNYVSNYVPNLEYIIKFRKYFILQCTYV